MSAPLDSRVVRIIRWLLDQTRPRSTAALAADLGLSQRVVRYRLGAVESYLRGTGLSLVRQRGSGLWIEGPAEAVAELRERLGSLAAAPRVYAREEREHVMLASLLWAAPAPSSLDTLQEQLEVSKASARRDLKRTEPWLERRGLLLARQPGVGISVVGNEITIRKALVQLVVEATPEDVLGELCTTPFEQASLVRVRVPAGMRDHLASIPLETAARVVSESGLTGMLDEGNSELVLCVYLAVAAARLREGKAITLDTGQHRSLVDHPLSASAARVAEVFETGFGLDLPAPEVAGITEYLLGLVALGADAHGKSDHEDLVEQLTSVAAELLDPALGTDLELRRSLSQHLGRLAVRLRYGLPVFNPLLGEVAERYADVHAVAQNLGEVISAYFDAQLEEDEVGYITMYLSGAMERSRLFPGRRVLVVCPSGMATAWVLVSRIQAEFPQFDVVQVLSRRSYQTLGDHGADLVISTVDIAENGVPVVVVNPLLTPADIRRLSAHV